MSLRYDLAVLGGGVVGLSIAAECAKRKWRVCLFERGEIGKESSWAGAGILPAGATHRVDDPIERLRQLSDSLHEDWSKWLLDLTKIDNEYRRCGGLYLARSPAEKATLRANCYWWEELGIHYERIQQDQISRLSPAVIPVFDPAQEPQYYWVERDAKLRNTRHLAALKSACVKLDVTFFEHSEVVGFRSDGSQIVGLDWSSDSSVSTPDPSPSRLVADRYCIATGAWTNPLVDTLGIKTEIYPVRGQMQLYRFEEVPFRFVLNEGHRYMVPREDGRVLVGSCEEEVGFVKDTTPEMMLQLRQWALEVCPGLARAELEMQWSGLRPGSIDGFPYLGTLHPYHNAFIAAGHFRHGLHWSTATAVLMAQHMFGEPTSIDLEPFRLHRGKVGSIGCD